MPDAVAFRDFFCPSLITIRPPSIDALPQCFQLSFVEWCVDSIDPSGKPWQRPTCQEFGKGFGRLIPPVKRTVGPEFRFGNQLRSKRIALNVPTQNVEVGIVLNGKAFVTRLVNVTIAASMVMRVIPKRMRCSNPSQQLSHLMIPAGPQDKMPVVWHKRKREEFDLISLKPFR